MVNVAKLIRDWRHYLDMSQDLLAEKADTARGIISLYEVGGVCPTAHSLQSIADAMGITLEELFTGPVEQATITETADVEQADRLSREIDMVPLVEAWDKAKPAGGPRMWPVPRRLLTGPSCVVTRIGKTTLQPELLEGDVVVVDPSLRNPRPGDAVLVSLGGTIMARRVSGDGPALTLEPDGDDDPPLEMGDDDRLLGRITGLVERVIS